MKLTTFSTAIVVATFPTTYTVAAGLDRTGQSVSAFLQPGNYAEAGLSVLDADVQGVDAMKQHVDDMAESYITPSVALKVQATDHISLGLIYDQPFGADAQYQTDSVVFGQNSEGTSVEVDTNNITALVGYQPTENWNLYAGAVYQTVEADISLRGAAYSNSGYDIHVSQEPAFGWVAGFAYQIPEIALKAAVTYRSEIKHNATAEESFALGGLVIPSSDVAAITPQSVNIDLQSGVAENTLAFANIRWVHWDNFVVTPQGLYNMTKGNNLIDYSKDQWSVNTGLGHKFSEHWSASSSVGYDSGAGNPVTTLGPTEGYWNVGLGAQFSPTENHFIQAGVKYFWLGDATAQTAGKSVAKFKDNTAMGYGMKIGYRF